MNEKTELITEMIKEHKALTLGHIAADKASFTDPFLCQHMRGRVAVEENEIKWLDKLLAVLE